MGFWAVFKRELLSLWVTPLAWVLMFAFLVLQGTSFFLMLDHFSKFASPAIDAGPVQGYFASLFVPVTLLIVCPALTMRLFAEERLRGTIELLLTAPVSASSVVWGKYLATVVTYTLMWSPTVLYVFILRNTGSVDWSVIGSSYLGLLMVGICYLAVGTLASALTKSQIIAFMLTVLGLFGLFILGIGERVFDPGLLLEICRHVSILSQLEDFSKGIVDSRRLYFDGSLALLAIFICIRVVDSWRHEA